MQPWKRACIDPRLCLCRPERWQSGQLSGKAARMLKRRGTGPPTASRPGSASPATMVLRDGKMPRKDGRQTARIISKLWPQGAKNCSHHHREMRPKALLTKLIEEAASPEAKALVGIVEAAQVGVKEPPIAGPIRSTVPKRAGGKDEEKIEARE
ncbi:MAG: hypothetical protein NTY37_13220 [Methanothrix sp.]|nr:hypothetical protein [Methanothrix sp.]